ncbi:hypothetical protein BV22DRAFT_1019506, partial [Leucogyrophana mollusca]
PQLPPAEIHEALFYQGLERAPGGSQVDFLVLRWSWPLATSEIAGLIKHCVKSGYHP